jgi:hypothetical protein
MCVIHPLQPSAALSLLVPAAYCLLLLLQATPFQRMQWSVLNSAVSLCGYFAAAAFVDKPWWVDSMQGRSATLHL